MPRDFEYDHVFVDGPVVHHWDRPGWAAWRPGKHSFKLFHDAPNDTCKSMSPVDSLYYGTEGGGANGTPRYLAQDADDADEFYAESTPTWWIPGRYFDLRDTWATMYLKEIKPIRVAPGFQCRFFIASYMPKGLPRPNHRLSCWYMKETLTIGQGEWAYNEVFVANDPTKWVNYHSLAPQEDTLDEVLAHCGFLGWMYTSDEKKTQAYKGVHGYGTLGWDGFHYNLKKADLEDLRAGRPLKNALVL
jgi:hypothetical protein